jgi:hypothetical protein
MRRLRRILLNLATVLSLGLGIAVVVLWVRSYLVSDSIYRSRWWIAGGQQDESAWWVMAGRGEVGVGRRRQQLTPVSFFLSERPPEDSWKYARPAEVGATSFEPNGFFQWLGFRYVDQPDPLAAVATNNYYREWNAPFWSLLLLCAPLPVARVWLALRRRRARGSGRCAVCGYDLRATPRRCPECGAVPEDVTT